MYKRRFINTDILTAIRPRTLKIEIHNVTAVTPGTLKFEISKHLRLLRTEWCYSGRQLRTTWWQNHVWNYWKMTKWPLKHHSVRKLPKVTSFFVSNWKVEDFLFMFIFFYQRCHNIFVLRDLWVNSIPETDEKIIITFLIWVKKQYE